MNQDRRPQNPGNSVMDETTAPRAHADLPTRDRRLPPAVLGGVHLLIWAVILFAAWREVAATNADLFRTLGAQGPGFPYIVLAALSLVAVAALVYAYIRKPQTFKWLALPFLINLAWFALSRGVLWWMTSFIAGELDKMLTRR